jgi:hypothetical protein
MKGIRKHKEDSAGQERQGIGLSGLHELMEWHAVTNTKAR